MQSMLLVYLCIYLCICQQDYCKSNQPISVKLDAVIAPTNGISQLTFGSDLFPDTDSGSFSTSLSIAEYGILEDLLAFLIQSSAVFKKIGVMTDTDEGMNPLLFGSNPAIAWIQINPEI